MAGMTVGGSSSGGAGAAGTPNANGGATSGGIASAVAGLGGAAGDAAAAGAPDNAPSGAAGMRSSNCPTSAQWCLDFEDGGFDGWLKKESGGTIAVDTTLAHGGVRSLAIHTPAGKRGAHLEASGAPLFPLPTGKLWGRMMVYVDGVPDGHTNFASGSGMGGGSYNVSEQHGSFMMSYYAGSAATDCWARPKAGVKVPSRRWSCWEWSFDGEHNQLQYWLDGSLLVTVDGTGDGCLSGNGVWKAPSEFQTLQIGEEIQQPGAGESSVWIDDVAVSNVERLGCPIP
jgi:hypothetical protein